MKLNRGRFTGKCLYCEKVFRRPSKGKLRNAIARHRCEEQKAYALHQAAWLFIGILFYLAFGKAPRQEDWPIMEPHANGLFSALLKIKIKHPTWPLDKQWYYGAKAYKIRLNSTESARNLFEGRDTSK